MVKITYDLDNKEEVELVDDYFFTKFYMKSIYDNWKQYNDLDNRWKYDYEDKEKIIQNIIKHLNPYEFKRLCEIVDSYAILGYNKEYETIDLILTQCDFFLKCHKSHLVRKFGDKK